MRRNIQVSFIKEEGGVHYTVGRVSRPQGQGSENLEFGTIARWIESLPVRDNQKDINSAKTGQPEVEKKDITYSESEMKGLTWNETAEGARLMTDGFTYTKELALREPFKMNVVDTNNDIVVFDVKRP